MAAVTLASWSAIPTSSDPARRPHPAVTRVLFLCVHNSARSQMAEGMLRTWGSGRYEALSAGSEATRVRPEAIAVMDELGIDLRGQRSKAVAEFAGQHIDWAITACDENQEACPVFPAATHHEYWPFDDPSRAAGTDAERLAVYRRVRDELAAKVREFLARTG
jgi:arsenate reductase